MTTNRMIALHESQSDCMDFSALSIRFSAKLPKKVIPMTEAAFQNTDIHMWVGFRNFKPTIRINQSYVRKSTTLYGNKAFSIGYLPSHTKVICLNITENE